MLIVNMTHQGVLSMNMVLVPHYRLKHIVDKFQKTSPPPVPPRIFIITTRDNHHASHFHEHHAGSLDLDLWRP